MKKIMFTIAIAAFAAGTLLTACNSSAKKVENAQDEVNDASKDLEKAEIELNQARLDSVEQFRQESDARILANEKSIVEFRLKIAKEKREARISYEKKIAVLEQKNSDMKKKLAEYNDDGKDRWYSFKNEFNHDMDELGQAFKDLGNNNVR